MTLAKRNYLLMIENGLKEGSNLNLSKIWNFCDIFAHSVLVSDINKNFLPRFNNFLVEFMNTNSKDFINSLNSQIIAIIQRSKSEKSFWFEEIAKINNYSREQAINELIKSRKIYEKLNQIDSFIMSLTQ